MATARDHIAKLEALGKPVTSEVAAGTLATALRKGDQLYGPDDRSYVIRTRSLPAPPDLPHGAIDALLESAAARTSPLSAVLIHHFHGAAVRVAPQDTPFGTRQAHQMVEIIASWRSGGAAPHAQWARQSGQMLDPYALPGGYPNFIGPDRLDQAADAYGPNAHRLLAAKRRYDPDAVFAATPLPADQPAAVAGPSGSGIDGYGVGQDGAGTGPRRGR